LKIGNWKRNDSNLPEFKKSGSNFTIFIDEATTRLRVKKLVLQVCGNKFWWDPRLKKPSNEAKETFVLEIIEYVKGLGNIGMTIEYE